MPQYLIQKFVKILQVAFEFLLGKTEFQTLKLPPYFFNPGFEMGFFDDHVPYQ